MNNHISDRAVIVVIKGLVQGVGFRPFVYNLARQHQFSGWVRNTNYAVYVHVQGEANQIDAFISEISTKKPAASRIDSIEIQNTALENLTDFSIIKSTSESDAVTSISPDIAVCSECLKDMKEHPYRINYPLVNCCHCGPRFSIVKALPYDRENTTMNVFRMCPECEKEYQDPADRRFHAQPVACNVCGPKYSLHFSDGGQIVQVENIEKILEKLKLLLSEDGIVAFKGTGGFHLVCNAESEAAVSRLRKVKHRDTKPFALMFRNIEAMKSYAYVSETEEKELISFRRPIVILEEKKSLAPSVNLGLTTIGAMLPYMPFHHLLFEHIPFNVLVMTSGNISDEPVIIDNAKALLEFIHEVDAVLVYNRDIHNRLDDSVLRVINNIPRMIRRSRGYVPEEIALKENVEGILATGAELAGAFAIGKANSAIMSQYIGDLQNVENFQFYKESYSHFIELFRFKPHAIVHDLHPDYLSTRFVDDFSQKKISIQHHHAHISSVMAENNLSEQVIGIAFDGTGLGTDGKIWGSEFLICSGTSFERAFHFEYTPLPGGDKVISEPWRTAMGQLYHYFGRNLPDFQFLNDLPKAKTSLLLQALEKEINIAYSCSAGRLFDAVAVASGICIYPHFHAEAPMKLEAAIDKSCILSYSFERKGNVIGFQPMWLELHSDMQQNQSKGVIAAKFHNMIVNVVVESCTILKEKFQLNTVALSGGSFQNKYLLENIENQLQNLGFSVFSNKKVPCNDGGIALGQLYLASKMIK